MKLFSIMLVWAILLTAIFISTKEKPRQKPSEEDLKWIDELIDRLQGETNIENN